MYGESDILFNNRFKKSISQNSCIETLVCFDFFLFLYIIPVSYNALLTRYISSPIMLFSYVFGTLTSYLVIDLVIY